MTSIVQKQFNREQGSLHSLFKPEEKPKDVSSKKLLCSISVDMDSFEILLRFYGHCLTSTKGKSFYETVVPRFLEIFERFHVKATFFVIGTDLLHKENQRFLCKIFEAGHEVANHTYSHPFGLHTMPWQERVKEIEKNEKLIEDITGCQPVGFRAPGYAIDNETLQILEDRGYLYDTSIFPTFISPLFKLVHKTLLKKRDHVNSGMGEWRTSLAPCQPYFPHKEKIHKQAETRNILEIPVSVTPLLRLPFYANFHLLLGKRFFDFSIQSFKQFEINYLFHGIELVDFEADKIDENLAKHPNVNKSLEAKITFYEHVLSQFSARYRVLCLRDFAEKYIQARKQNAELKNDTLQLSK